MARSQQVIAPSRPPGPASNATAPSKPAALRDRMRSGPLLRVMGAHDGLSARLAERAGYDAIWASGLGISATHGVPDNSVLTMTEFLDAAEVMNAAVDAPVIADCDTGFGDVNAVVRMVRRFEARGIAAVCIEDKQYPKRNSFRDGQRLAEREEFAARLAAASGARRDPGFQIVARLESFIAETGLEDAMGRAMLYRDAGADALLVHSKASSPQEVLAFAERWHACGGDLPLVVVPTTYFSITESQLEEADVAMVIYANQALRAAVMAMERAMTAIAADGTSRHTQDVLAPLDQVFELIGTPGHEAQEREYGRLVADLRAAITWQ